MEPDVMMMLAEMVKEAKRRVEIGLMRSAECANGFAKSRNKS
jgi:hypothetical protein